MTDEFKNHLIKKHQDCVGCPSNETIKSFFEEIMGLLFPNFSNKRISNWEQLNGKIEEIKSRLVTMLDKHPNLCQKSPSILSDDFVCSLADIESALQLDIDAIYNGDPAAKNKEEIIRSYPGFYAISAYRIAHRLLALGINIVPRIITELAHHRTGIDIHPGAKIDHSFCIDHGTGVVIGETCIIGPNVKIYQGVTLGALSVQKKDANNKRHPSIENNVVIYANATILGGETIIGHHSIIGGNSWITESVDPYSTIYYVAGDNQVEKTKKQP